MAVRLRCSCKSFRFETLARSFMNCYFRDSRLKVFNQFQFKLIQFFFACDKKPAKNMISSWRDREKEIVKLLSGWTKTSKKVMKSIFFARRCTHRESHFRFIFCWDCTTDKKKEKTTSEIRKQIKYFINYLYFHNMII